MNGRGLENTNILSITVTKTLLCTKKLVKAPRAVS